ncbi:MAG: helix-turn-helix transcriptional regulator [Clostridia bacterium]|nr:helix-turn-helix transcriptional regulator [Clostridia bacterium]
MLQLCQEINKKGLSGMVGLRMIRKQKGYSQLKVAMDLSISREALSYYESGKRSPDVKMLLRLSEYFDVSIHFLITGKEFESKKD